MTDDLNDLLDSDQSGPKQLPQMINVLTILTFVGSGLSLLSSLWSFATLSQTRKTLEMSREMQEEMNSEIDNPFVNNMMEGTLKMLENGPTLYTVGAIVAILSILGALQMRKLKKNGFYLYSVANIAGVAVPLAIVGFGFMGSMILLGSIFTILFIILYAVNLKHMS